MTEKRFPASAERLDDVIAFAEEELERVDFPMRETMLVTVALEEMFVNVAHYAYPGGEGEVTVRITAEADSVTICLIDSGMPFNPLERVDPDVEKLAEEDKIGGLGIYMVKKSMTSVDYQYHNGCNEFTMTKIAGT